MLVGRDIAAALFHQFVAGVAEGDNTHGDPIPRRPDAHSTVAIVVVVEAVVDNSHMEVAEYWDTDMEDKTIRVGIVADWEFAAEYVVV